MESEDDNGPRSAGWLELPNGGGFLVRELPLPTATSPEPTPGDFEAASGAEGCERVIGAS